MLRYRQRRVLALDQRATCRSPHTRSYGASGERRHDRRSKTQSTEYPTPRPNDLSRSLAALEHDNTLIAVIEMSQKSWLVGAIVPGIERHPLKKLMPDEDELLRLLHRWRDEATKAGRTIRDQPEAVPPGLASNRDDPLAAGPRHRGMSSMSRAWRSRASIAGRRPITCPGAGRVELLKRAFLGWLRGERDHCRMAANPALETETPGGRVASARSWSASAPASSTASDTACECLGDEPRGAR